MKREMTKVTNVNFLYSRSNSALDCPAASTSSGQSPFRQSNCRHRDSQLNEAHMTQLSPNFQTHSHTWMNQKIPVESSLNVKLLLNSVFAVYRLLRKQQIISLFIAMFLITQNTADCIRMNHAAHRRTRSRWVPGDDEPRQRRSNGGSSVLPSDGSGIPCVYEGRVDTERNWYGFLANISVRTTGQLLFEFVYPAHRCCQNVLFYPEDQLAVISPRMNCWQREYLLRPEDDQILRLTPSFSWSGCHMTVHGGTDMFVCKGGRSFSVDSYGERLTTWYVAVSNCAAQHGLDLYYRIEIYGHVGECVRQPPNKVSQSLPGSRDPSGSPRLENTRTGQRVASDRPSASVTKASLIPREAGGADPEHNTDPPVCIVEGVVNTTKKPWHGFIKNISLAAGGGFRYEFSYPRRLEFQNIILYNENDIRKLDWELECPEKEYLIGSEQLEKQIIEMYHLATFCRVSNGTIEGGNDTQTTTCRGEKRYSTPQKIFMALSNCRSSGVYLQYRLEVFGYTPATFCSAVALYRQLSQLQIVAIAAAVATLLGRLASHVQLYGPLLGDEKTSRVKHGVVQTLIYQALGSFSASGFMLTRTAIIVTAITCVYLLILVWKSTVLWFSDDFL